MKKILILTMLIFTIVNCQEKRNNIMNKKIDENLYFINFQSSNPFELRLNDVLISKKIDNKKSTDFLETINEYILISGEQRFSISLLPRFGVTKVTKNDLNSINIEIYKSSNIDDENFILIKKINLPIIEKEFYTYNFDLDLQIPYENNGWINSIKFEYNDQNIKNEVYNFYSKIREIINRGDYKNYFELFEKQDNEISISLLLTEEQKILEKNTLKERIVESKGKMKPIDFTKYSLKFYGEGKLVTLEDKEGNSPLCADREDVESYYNFLLHRPKAGGPLEIIR